MKTTYRVVLTVDVKILGKKTLNEAMINTGLLTGKELAQSEDTTITIMSITQMRDQTGFPTCDFPGFFPSRNTPSLL